MGYTFAGWSGALTGTANPTSLLVDCDKTFTAIFTAPVSKLYFPHVATSTPWQTEITIINTGNQPVTGTLWGVSDTGQPIDAEQVILPAHGRRQINVANEFTHHTSIAYIIFGSSSAAVQGYTKFSGEGHYRAAIPAVKEVNASDIHIPHIAANADWWTGLSLVNTTSAAKVLTITFNNGESEQISLAANQHRAFDIAEEFFNNQPPPDIESAVITNAGGVIGLELFGSVGWGPLLEGILLTDKTAPTIYYPHVDTDGWWTGIVAYNPSASAGTMTITSYKRDGTFLSSQDRPIAAQGKYVGTVAELGLPDQTAWFKIVSTSESGTAIPLPLAGFELFGTLDGSRLGAYAGNGAGGSRTGVFPKIEKDGWTGIAFVNTQDGDAFVSLTAYDNNGTPVGSRALDVRRHARVVTLAEDLFSEDISDATYIAYSADREVVGFQLNGSTDDRMLDGLPAL